MQADADHWRHELIDVALEPRRRRSWRSTSARRRSPPTTSARPCATPRSTNAVVPILCGTAFKNKGVQPLLDAVVDYLPSPLDLPPITGVDLKGIEELERAADDGAPFAALAFKIMTDPYVGKLTYFRVYCGMAKKGATVLNSTKRPQGAHRPHPADARQPPRGQGGRLRGRHRRRRRVSSRRPPATRSATPTRRSCSSRWSSPSRSSTWRSSPRPRPTRTSSATPSRRSPRKTRPSRSHTDEETGQTIIAGMGELHLEVLVDRMLREFKVDANVGKPQVAYRETIRDPADQGRGALHPPDRLAAASTATCVIDLEPTGPGGGYEFVDKITRRRHPQGVHPVGRRRDPGGAAERRARRLPDGRRAGHAHLRLVPRRRLVGDGVQDRRLPGPEEGRPQARPVLLEPIMAVEVVTPEDYMGDVIGDLSSPPGQDRGHGAAGQQPGDPCSRPSVGDVRLRYRPAFADPGSRHVHHAVRLVSGDARVDLT